MSFLEVYLFLSIEFVVDCLCCLVFDGFELGCRIWCRCCGEVNLEREFGLILVN